jgi:hypothetical protein
MAEGLRCVPKDRTNLCNTVETLAVNSLSGNATPPALQVHMGAGG